MSYDRLSVSDPPESPGGLTTVLLVQGTWMLGALVVLFLADEYSVENYFIVSFIGLISVLHVFAPSNTRPRWWWVLKWVTRAGYVVFALIMYRRVSEVAVII